MDPFSASCSRLRRFVSEHIGITSVTVLVTFPIMASLAALVVFSDLACSSPTSTTPTPRLTPPPPHERKPTPTPSPPATPLMVFPPVMLEEPKDGSCLACGSEVALRWHFPYALQEDESYQLKVEGPDSSIVYRERKDYNLNALSTGQYSWTVTVVRSQGLGQYVAVSGESDTYRFEIAPPAPVVHSISPTSTVQGASVPVVVSGEHLTRSLTIIIGDVTLQTTFVDSSTIAATIPAFLETGKYRVDVKDTTDETVWSGSLTVLELPPSLGGGTPTPPAYLSPELTGLDIIGCNVTFHWSYPRELAKDEYYAVRFDIGSPGHSRAWVKETEYTAVLKDPGEYAWKVAICQGELETGVCNQLAVSEPQAFEFRGCEAW